MQKRYARKLHNRDEVEVRIDNKWQRGYVLGEPKETFGRVIIPVQTEKDGWMEIDHTDVR